MLNLIANNASAARSANASELLIRGRPLGVRNLLYTPLAPLSDNLLRDVPLLSRLFRFVSGPRPWAHRGLSSAIYKGLGEHHLGLMGSRDHLT